MKEHLLIAIDGPSGAGKSTMARLLAKRLGILYVDTGAMYRAICVKAARRGVDPHDEGPMRELLSDTSLAFRDVDGSQHILLDGEDVEEEIRTPEISRLVPEVAASPAVRAALCEMQRAMALTRPLVMEGRDIGSSVLPDARYKFFLTASPQVRARQRHAELREKGKEISYQDVLEDIKARDKRDSTREASPLRAADDAILIDTGGAGIEQVLLMILSHMEGNL